MLPLLLAAAIAGIAGSAWFYLVRSAIDFGQMARDGDSQAWVFMGAASLGAIACALLLLVLVTRALRRLGFISEYQPRRVARKRPK